MPKKPGITSEVTRKPEWSTNMLTFIEWGTYHQSHLAVFERCRAGFSIAGYLQCRVRQIIQMPVKVTPKCAASRRVWSFSRLRLVLVGFAVEEVALPCLVHVRAWESCFKPAGAWTLSHAAAKPGDEEQPRQECPVWLTQAAYGCRIPSIARHQRACRLPPSKQSCCSRYHAPRRVLHFVPYFRRMRAGGIVIAQNRPAVFLRD